MIPDKSQDLIIVDPPYYKAINEKWDNQWKNEQEYLDWCKLWFNECVRTLKDTGSFYCYGNFDILSKQKVLIFDDVLNFRQNITLSKGLKSIAGRTSNKLRMFPTASEYLVFYTVQDMYGVKGSEKIKNYMYSEFEKSGLSFMEINRDLLNTTFKGGGGMAYNLLSKTRTNWDFPTKDKYIKLQKSGFWGKPYDELKREFTESRFTFNLPTGQTDVWDFTPDKVRYGHPTQKPQDICQRIIKASSNENDNVLIPFAGSGSECVACDDLKRNWIAFENDKDNFSMSKKRVEKNKRKRLEELNFDKALN